MKNFGELTKEECLKECEVLKMGNNIFDKFNWLQIGFAATIVMISILLFTFYAKLIGVMFFALAGFVYITFLFNVPWKERLLAGLLAITLFLWDVLQNKIADKGLEYSVHVTSNVLIKATTLLYLSFVVMFTIITYLVIFAVINNKGNKITDMIVGSVAYLGLAFLFGTALISFYHPPTFLLPFFSLSLATITIYHFAGIMVLIITTLYFIITE